MEQNGAKGQYFICLITCIIVFNSYCPFHNNICIPIVTQKPDLSIEVLNLIFLLTEYCHLINNLIQSFFWSKTLIQLNDLIIQIFCSVSLYSTCLNSFSISSLFSSGITISSTFFGFSSGTGFNFTVYSEIAFPMNLPVDSAVICTTYFEAVFTTSSPVFVGVSNNYFPYLLEIFLANDKIPQPSRYLLVFGSIE